MRFLTDGHKRSEHIYCGVPGYPIPGQQIAFVSDVSDVARIPWESQRSQVPWGIYDGIIVAIMPHGVSVTPETFLRHLRPLRQKQLPIAYTILMSGPCTLSNFY